MPELEVNFFVFPHPAQEDFESVLKDIGRPKFVEQLMMALHQVSKLQSSTYPTANMISLVVCVIVNIFLLQFPGSEHLPWTRKCITLSCSHIVYCQSIHKYTLLISRTTEWQSQHSRHKKGSKVLGSHFLLTK